LGMRMEDPRSLRSLHHSPRNCSERSFVARLADSTCSSSGLERDAHRTRLDQASALLPLRPGSALPGDDHVTAVIVRSSIFVLVPFLGARVDRPTRLNSTAVHGHRGGPTPAPTHLHPDPRSRPPSGLRSECDVDITAAHHAGAVHRQLCVDDDERIPRRS